MLKDFSNVSHVFIACGYTDYPRSIHRLSEKYYYSRSFYETLEIKGLIIIFSNNHICFIMIIAPKIMIRRIYNYG